MSKFRWAAAAVLLLQVSMLRAGVFGRVEGLVHDSQHRPIAGARVTIRAAHSEFRQGTETNREGVFSLPAVPLGEYTVRVERGGFGAAEQDLSVSSDRSANLHFELQVAGVKETVTVMGRMEGVDVESVTPVTMVERKEIAETPGADRTNSLQMITDFVPGAYMTHDMLHMRGGHQVSWAIDGVVIPNTNIASNVGAQIDPKDVDSVEVQRGSYSAEVGDRTYGVFNVVPRNGFERNNEGEVVLSLGSYFQTNDQVNVGSHTDRFAYYVSGSGNRSGYGLAPPVEGVFHDAANGAGGFGSLIYNRTPRDQFRVVAQVRRDFFQIPYDPDANSAENEQYDSSGLRDGQHEVDGLVEGSWAHTFGGATLLQMSPFFHYNRADYEPGAGDRPIATTSERGSNYAGMQASVTGEAARNTVQAGVYGFGQRDSDVFGAEFSDGSGTNFRGRGVETGGLAEEFVSDSVRVRPWLTVIGGVRATEFTGGFTETAVTPRIGAAVRVPKLHWVFRGFYGRFYQPPPLLTTSGPLLAYANSENTTFAPLHGERDEEHQVGVQIPLRGWLVDADTFKTRARNFLDHSNIGESSIYLPVTVDGALINGWELTLRSPEIAGFGRVHLAYSNQVAKQRGGLTGGLVCAPAAGEGCDAGFGYVPLDHDQRNTLSVGMEAQMPWRAYASGEVSYGSGFSNGSPDARYPGVYLPGHTAVDLSVGKRFGEGTTVSVNALNVGGQRVLLDNSLTFGGFHFSDPREVYGEVRFRFRY